MRKSISSLVAVLLLSSLQVAIDRTPAAAHTQNEQANSHSENPSISGSGRIVAYQSAGSNLVAGDTNNALDIFVRDKDAGSTERVSITSAGAQANSSSQDVSLSRDGRYVAFHSYASNLVPGDTNGALDVFVHDRSTRITTRVSVTSSGAQSSGGIWGIPSISGDGRYVVFASGASNLVAGDGNAEYDVFLHDRTTGSTSFVSKSTQGSQGNSASMSPWISADGTTVAFYSVATNLVAGDSNSTGDIFARNLQTGQTTRVSVGASGTQSNGQSDQPVVSSDGRYVSFESVASNLVAGDSNGVQDIFVHDRVEGDTVRASVSTSGQQGNGTSLDAYISGNGRWVSFYSQANNIHGGPDTNGTADIFVHDIFSGYTVMISFGCNGNDCTQQSNGASYNPVTDDGSVVAYESQASNIDYSDTTPYRDIFTSEITSGTDELISKSGNVAPSTYLSVSPTQGTTSTSFSASMSGTHDQNGDAITYRIAWGDGTSTTSSSGSHTYAASGGYTITATATDQHGAASSRTQQVLVDNRAPVAQLSVTPTSGNRSTTFSASMSGSSDPDGDTLTYQIAWGDGSVSSSQSATHVYSSLGTFTVTGTATDSRGASSTATKTITVTNRAPQATLTVTPTQGDTDTVFQASLEGSIDPDGDLLSYRINWDDGTSTFASSGNHRYESPGRYVITGTVVDPSGEASSDPETIVVCEVFASGVCVAQPDEDPMTACNETGACPTVPEPPDEVPSPYSLLQQTADPDDGLPLSEERDVTIVSLNIGNDSTPGDVARRIKTLANKDASASPGDGISRIPDIVVLQEATKVVAGQIADLIGTEVLGDGQNENSYLVAAGEETKGHGNTAIIFRDSTVNLTPGKLATQIRTFHKASDIPGGGGSPLAYTDPDTGEVIDCPQGDGYRRHWMQQFNTKVSGFGIYTFTVASIHVLTKGCLRDAVEAELYDEWATKIGNRMTSEYTGGSNARLAAGDFNEDRCAGNLAAGTEPKECAERLWYRRITDGPVPPETRNPFGFLDAVWEAECRGSGRCTSMNNQYKDGSITRNRRIDYIFVKKANIVRASHDLSCGAGTGGNCKLTSNRDYYSDHRLVWATFKG